MYFSGISQLGYMWKIQYYGIKMHKFYRLLMEGLKQQLKQYQNNVIQRNHSCILILLMNQSLNLGALDTSKHSLNTSGSKQKFSFPKANRFNHIGKILCDSFYQIPSTKGARSTSFGYGNKTMGIKIDKQLPQPTSYNLASQFQQKNKGSSFGEGRQKMLLGGPMKDSIIHKFIPGPGKYQSNYSTLEVPSISIKSRIPDKSLDYLKRLPGPGAYNHQQMGGDKYYVSSRHPCSGLSKISPSHKLQPINRSSSVGPGQYNSQGATDISETGRYPLSQNSNSRARIFSKQKRATLVNKAQTLTPGPGNYQIFSSFG